MLIDNWNPTPFNGSAGSITLRGLQVIARLCTRGRYVPLGQHERQARPVPGGVIVPGYS